MTQSHYPIGFRLILLSLTATLWLLPASARGDDNDSISPLPRIVDVFTGGGVATACMVIYNEDGSVYLDSTQLKPLLVAFKSGYDRKWSSYYRVKLPRRTARYRFHVESPGYKPLDMWYTVTVRGRGVTTSPEHLLLRLQRDYQYGKEQKLGEAVVTATKIKFYHKGDTLIYNADAFNLPEGSMLSDLIRQLPGATLNSNGEIFINGRKLDYLLLNGKDFYKGNNRIMLDNLPHYTVKQLKVYETSTERSQALGHDVDEKDYVMDVRLKKEYATGYLGNLQAAGGTHERYLARLFGLRFTDFSRFSLFATTNNINESRRPGADTDWRPTGGTIGTDRRHEAGFDLSTSDREGTWSEGWLQSDNESRTAAETFLEGQSAYSRSRNRSTNKNFNAQFRNDFTLRKPFYLRFQTSLAYSHYDRRGTASGHNFNTHPDSIPADTVNATADRWTGSGWSVTARQDVSFLRHMAWGDDIEAGAWFNYDKSRGDDFSRYDVSYRRQPALSNNRHRYNDLDQHSTEYATRALYRLNFTDDLRWELNWQFRRNQTFSHEARYRLDELTDEWNADRPLTWLPSNRILLQQALDRDNARYTDHSLREHTLGSKLHVPLKKDHNLDFDYRLIWQDERYHTDRQQLDTVMRRRHATHNASARYKGYTKTRKNWKFEYSLSYNYKQTAPDMDRLVPISDTYNPLAVTQGNPDLKDEQSHNLHLWSQLLRLQPHYTIYYMNAGTSFYPNRIGMATRYDRITGVYTYRPANLNGNWSAYIFNNFSRRMLPENTLNLGLSTGYVYARNVDFVQAEQADALMRSRVSNQRIEGSVNLSYDFRRLSLGGMAEAKHRRADSRRPDFQPIRATDLTYGLNLTWRMPWELTLATDLKMYSRRGYGDASMNTDDLVWNASLSRAFLKGRLSVNLQGFDLLHNLSNVTYAINGQGRTETWNRSIPRYFMLHLQWKFNKNPKKRN